MSTPIVSSLEKLHELDFGSDPVDGTKYRYLIGPLVYLMRSRLVICYDVSEIMFDHSHRH